MTSRLDDSASPYVRAHAGNPVAWYPWGEGAFARARERDVPVMVSVGYSTCHWCHVMARESFEDPATAAVLNEGFVAVKVDREEHPEVDAAYLSAAAAFTPHLGWPLTVFTTPSGRPFYAGTYWPGEPRGGMPAFRTVLAAVREAWTERRGEVARTADALVRALADAAERESAPAGLPPAALLTEAAERVAAAEDPEHGGFAPAGASPTTPKFPAVPALRLLQAPLFRSRAGLGAVARRAIDAMAASPLRDPVDGGFFRYATRRDWTEPHYERMLTDNAGLALVALDAGRPEIARGIAGFLVDVLALPSGGLGAAQDSESWIDGERSEGGFYGRDAAGRAGLVPPDVDAKVVTGWNGLAVRALVAVAERVATGDERARLRAAARRAVDAVMEANVTAEGLLRRASLDEIPSRAPATLEDYGSFARGLVALAAATGEVAYAAEARRLVDLCVSDGVLAVPGGGDPVLAAQGVTAGEDADTDRPSGPASVAGAALALWSLGAGEPYRAVAERVVAARAEAALHAPLSHGAVLRLAAALAAPPRQIVVVSDGTDGTLADGARTRAADVVATVTSGQAAAFADAGFSLFEGKTALDGVPTAYDCRGFACRLPVSDPRLLEP